MIDNQIQLTCPQCNILSSGLCEICLRVRRSRLDQSKFYGLDCLACGCPNTSTSEQCFASRHPDIIQKVRCVCTCHDLAN